VTAILAGIFFGLANLFMGSTSYAGFVSQEIISVGTLIVGLMYFAFMLLQSKHKNGYYWKWKKSYYYNPHTNGVNWLVIGIASFLALVFFFTGILILLTFEFALYGDLNQGIVSTLFSITSIYLAILFWVVYKQKMNLCDFAGMILLIVSAIMMVFSKGDSAQDEIIGNGASQYSISPAWSVLFAIL
jgi:drug/metabolite transporter (DMT)-like permease